jgi:hypothetical protein
MMIPLVWIPAAVYRPRTGYLGGRTVKRVLSRVVATLATVASISALSVISATPASAHTGAHGVVAKHGGAGFTQYQEIVLGKGTTHWLATSPAWTVGSFLVSTASAHAGAPKWAKIAVAPGAGAYAVGTKVRIDQAEREGQCFSLVKVPYTWTYWPAKTRQGCR